MNVWDIVVAACVALALFFAVRSMRQARRRGKCASCPFAGGCDHRG